MKSTKELILDASLKVFSDKGYVSGTTLEISKQAGVSEMTLFRHFKTKNNLFLTTIKQAVGDSLSEDIDFDLDVSFGDFISLLLHEKISMISNNIKMVRMLIRESLSNTLPEELKFTKVIYNETLNIFDTYIKHNNLNVDSKSATEITVGILLRYAIMEDAPVYHKWSREKQIEYISTYINLLRINRI